MLHHRYTQNLVQQFQNQGTPIDILQVSIGVCREQSGHFKLTQKLAGWKRDQQRPALASWPNLSQRHQPRLPASPLSHQRREIRGFAQDPHPPRQRMGLV